MLQVSQTQANGYTVYKFEANATRYEVMTQDGIEFDVWSQRKALSQPTLNCYRSLAEMAKRSKSLRSLAALIEAETTESH